VENTLDDPLQGDTPTRSPVADRIGDTVGVARFEQRWTRAGHRSPTTIDRS
jgi:hypothetical protein